MSSPSVLTVPQTQNTAPVLEFRCLYTQDLRRKQKRWQDGRLKFHTFNKRVMVYDERSNFVGDTHWRDECGLNEGEELELERGGVLVEVGECVGTRDQDLSELVDKRVREKEKRAAAKAATPSATGPGASIARPQTSIPAGSLHLRPKPLNAVIGIPTGHYGRAMVSNLSPFEQKHSKYQEEDRNTRPSKRQKHSDTLVKSGYAQNLLGATLSLGSSRPINTQTLRTEPLKTSIRPQAETIDLTRDENGDETDLRPAKVQAQSSEQCSKVQKQKSPPAKSGYARNLTGAALTLSGSINSSTAKPRKVHSNSPTLPSPYDGTFDAPTHQKIQATRPIAKLKPIRREPSPRSSHRSKLATELHSPGAVQKAPISYRNVHMPDRTAAQLTAELPGTVLRIKPRPPRQMMMLMDASRLRQPDQGGSAVVTAEPHMASKVSNGFCPAATSSKNLSSWSNRASNANNTIVPSSSTSITDFPGPLESQNMDHLDHINPTERMAESLPELPVPVNGSMAKQNKFTFADNSAEMNLGQQESRSILHGRELIPESTNSSCAALEACSPQHRGAINGDILTSAEKSQPRRKSASKSSSLERTEASIISEPVFGTARKTGTISTVSGMDEHANVSGLLKPNKVPETGSHLSNPATSVKLHTKSALDSGSAQGAVELELPRAEDIETATTATDIKHSPDSITDIANYPTYAGKAAYHSVPSSTLRMLRRTALQAHPQTGARSLVNRAVPGPNNLAAKTSARTTARAEIVSIKGDPDVYSLGRESASRGPWSRESFDLFGAWRPPGRAA